MAARESLRRLESFPGMSDCRLQRVHYVLQVGVLDVGPRLAFPIAGEGIRCNGSVGDSRASQRRFESLPGATSVNGESQSGRVVGWFNSSHPYTPPLLFEITSTSYASRHNADALRLLSALPGIRPCSAALIRGRENASVVASSGGGGSIVGIGLPPNKTAYALYCAATSPSAVKRGVAALHASFPGFTAQQGL